MTTYTARYYDGVTSRALPSSVAIEADGLVITTDVGGAIRWPLTDIRAMPDAGDDLRLRHRDQDDDAVLVVTDVPAMAAFRAACPNLNRVDRMRAPAMARLGLWVGGAVGAFLLIVFVLIPALSERLAPLIPPDAEVALGNETVAYIAWLMADGRWCEGAEGTAALGTIAARLEPHHDAHVPIEIRVLDDPLINALAAPGGRIILFRGLIDQASSADEVAGVIAHEIGHVIGRDPTRNALRAAGTAGLLGLLIGDTTGGVVTAAVGEHLMNASYSRDIERAADATSAELLARAEVAIEPLMGFFERLIELSGDDPEWLEVLSTHPASADRIADLAAAAAAQGPTRPVLTGTEWAALQRICEAVDEAE